ncbi:unnamed protein product, partial [Polarella glacialis]
FSVARPVTIVPASSAISSRGDQQSLSKTPSTTSAAKPSTASSAASSAAGRSIGQRLRASLGGLFLEKCKPIHRKVGKQRPSCLVVQATRDQRAPKHRKVGKQRPSFLPPCLSSSKAASLQADSRGVKLGKSGKLVTALLAPSCRQQPAEVERTPVKAVAAAAAVPAAIRGSGSQVIHQQLEVESPEAIQSEKRKRSAQQSRITAEQAKPILKRVSLKAPKNEEDNYELSDMEEDANGDRIEPNRTGKRIPAWSVNFAQLAKAQENINPDSIFGCRVPAIDLEVIFPDHFYLGMNPGKKRRGSSCQWNNDKLTKREVNAYVSKMGQKQRWSTVRPLTPGHSSRNSASTQLPSQLVAALTKK